MSYILNNIVAKEAKLQFEKKMKLFREKKSRQCLPKTSSSFRGEHHTQQDKRDIQNTSNNTNYNNDEINVETIVATMYIHRSSVEWQQDEYN